ncbi:MAG: hypothetical protein IKY73_08035, partial [Bacteroidaceae bacterium]|nr:hypothetical protein [Bacteroidaceae bacterium]
MRQYISIIILALCLVACDKHSEHWEMLSQVESYIEERPDSALAVLERIDTEELSSKEERAKYAVLYAQAEDKNFIDERDLKLISEAKDYYEDSGNVRYKFLSLYYCGRILCNNKDYSSAIIAYIKAETLLEELNNGYLAGLLYVQIGNIYRDFHEYNKSL